MAVSSIVKEVRYRIGSQTFFIPKNEYVPILMRARNNALKLSHGNHEALIQDIHAKTQRGILEWANDNGQLQPTE